MGPFAQTVVSNAVLATLLALAASVTTRFWRQPHIACWLWSLVLVKLVTPPIVPLPVDLGAIVERDTFSPEVAAHGEASGPSAPRGRQVEGDTVVPKEAIVSSSPAAEGPNEDAALTPGTAEAEALRAGPSAAFAPPAGAPCSTIRPTYRGLSWTVLVGCVWVLGTACWLAMSGTWLLRFGRLMKQAGCGPEHLQAAAQELAGRFGLRSCPEVRVLEACIPPLLWFSGRRLVIVLPSELLGQIGLADQKTLLAHELAHCRRRDHWTRWLEAAILGLYWWHPVAWWASRRRREAEEQCCDAWVMWAFPGERRKYARVLLAAAEFLSVSQPAMPAVTSAFDAVGVLKRRLKTILTSPLDRRISRSGLAAVLMIGISVLPWSATVWTTKETGAVIAIAEDNAGVPPPNDAETAASGPPAAALQITGVVRGPDGSPVAAADVYLVAGSTYHPVLSCELPLAARPAAERARGYRMEIFGQARTDDAGRFAIAPQRIGLHAGIKDIVVRAAGLGLAHQDCDQGSGEVEVRMPRMVPIRGQLFTSNGTPAAGAIVRLVWLDDGKNHVEADRLLAEKDLPPFWPRPIRADADGNFTLAGVPADHHLSLHVTHPESAYEILTVDTGRGGQGRGDPVEVDPLPPVFGRSLGIPRPTEGVIHAADTGKPLAGATVVVVPMRNHLGRPFYTSTDQRGAYRVSGQAGDSYYLHAYPPPESGYLACEVRCNGWPPGRKSLVQDLLLRPGKVIRGRVLDEKSGMPVPGASVVYLPAKPGVLPARSVHSEGHDFHNPAATDRDGRFAVTGLPGRGCVMVETPQRIYLRRPLGDIDQLGRSVPMGYTLVEVPSDGPLEEEVVIRLQGGRTVALQAVGPGGEPLPSVLAAWDGLDAVHHLVWNRGQVFPKGQVVVHAVDPERTTRVFLLDKERKLGAVFDITAQTADGPVQVRLQPTATVVGQAIAPMVEAADAEAHLCMSFDPDVRQFKSAAQVQYPFYENFTRDRVQYGAHPGGRFMFENILPGAPFGVLVSRSGRVAITTIAPLKPGERRDLGRLAVPEQRQPASVQRSIQAAVSKNEP